MKERMVKGRTGNPKPGREGGFSALELVVVVAIVAVVGTMALAQRRAESAMRLTNATRLFAQNLEKARIDSKRRRAMTPAEMSSVRIVSPDRYLVVLDFAGTGGTQTREVQLPAGVTFNVEPPVIISFDWRGHATSDADVMLTGNYGSSSPLVRVSESGDVATGGDVHYSPENVNVSIKGTSVNGNTNLDSKTQMQ